MHQQYFDIFDVLGISRREDVLHTPMLAGLLDPFGGHSFGKAFLSSFLEVLSCPELPLNRHDSNYDWVIKQEHHVPGGRIDILLLCPEKKVAIAIENKIDATESRSQLPCYLTWLRALSPYFTNHGLVLLSPKGKQSRTILTGECRAIGYDQVLKCLDECLNQQPLGSQHSTIRSYARLLARILGVERHAEQQGNDDERLFNIFRFLRIARREATLHTRMLGFLLNPMLSGDTNAFFLRSFLSLFLPGENSQSERNDCSWEVEVEREIERGRLDILLRCKEQGRLIVKIDALEGQAQLDRYGDWMQTQQNDYPNQILVFLTVDARAPATAQRTRYRVLSYEQLMPLVEQYSLTVTAPSLRTILKDYLLVLKGIVPTQGVPTQSIGRRLAPCIDHSETALSFLRNLIERWEDLPAEGQDRPSLLKAFTPRLVIDSRYGGKYHAIEIWHTDCLLFQKEQILVVRVETNLGNRRMMGLYIGLQWRNTGTWEERKWFSLTEAVDLLSLGEKLYKLNNDIQRGHWFAALERIEYPKSDGGLISAFQHHATELQRTIVSRICNIWAFCGEKVLTLNKKLITLQHSP